MTYDEAAKAGQERLMDIGGPGEPEHLGHAVTDCPECKRMAEAVLDAIGFQKMQERVEELEQLLRVAGYFDLLTIQQERDAARALADQAFALLCPIAHPSIEFDRDVVWENDWSAKVLEFFTAYEARDWK